MEHTWNVTPKEAVALQDELRQRVRIESLRRKPGIIAGCDMSHDRFAKTGYAGFVVLAYPSLEILETAAVQADLTFPYVPGLLSFREIPMLLKAWDLLAIKPEVIVVDGHGIAHPRRMGIATHLGLALDLPTIGCAKSVLTGTYEEPGPDPGDRSPLVDKKDHQAVLGTVLRTRRGAAPVFVSPGHLITLTEATELVANCLRGYRIPEPTRLAHTVVNDARRKGALS